jgi:16S rRNA (uracil1498-N3)-methyltransferase
VTLAACLAGQPADLRLMLVEPAAGGAPVRPDTLRGGTVPSSALVLVGPEGGWAAEEIAEAGRAGCVMVTLGGRTLRADAAPLVALSVLLHVWGEM